MKQKIVEITTWAFFAIALICMILCLVSCSSTKYVPVEVETVRTEYVYADRVLRDSVYLHDSIYVAQKGDTTYIERWHTQYQEKARHDSIFIEKTDTVTIPQIVEAKLTKWQSVKQEIGGTAIGALALLTILVVTRLIRKYRE